MGLPLKLSVLRKNLPRLDPKAIEESQDTLFEAETFIKASEKKAKTSKEDAQKKRISIFDRYWDVFVLLLKAGMHIDKSGNSIPVEVTEVSGFPPITYGMVGTAITFHIPGITPEQFEEIFDKAVAQYSQNTANLRKPFHTEVDRMIDDGEF